MHSVMYGILKGWQKINKIDRKEKGNRKSRRRFFGFALWINEIGCESQVRMSGDFFCKVRHFSSVKATMLPWLQQLIINFCSFILAHDMHFFEHVYK